MNKTQRKIEELKKHIGKRVVVRGFNYDTDGQTGILRFVNEYPKKTCFVDWGTMTEGTREYRVRRVDPVSTEGLEYSVEPMRWYGEISRFIVTWRNKKGQMVDVKTLPLLPEGLAYTVDRAGKVPIVITNLSIDEGNSSR